MSDFLRALTSRNLNPNPTAAATLLPRPLTPFERTPADDGLPVSEADEQTTPLTTRPAPPQGEDPGLPISSLADLLAMLRAQKAATPPRAPLLSTQHEPAPTAFSRPAPTPAVVVEPPLTQRSRADSAANVQPTAPNTTIVEHVTVREIEHAPRPAPALEAATEIRLRPTSPAVMQALPASRNVRVNDGLDVNESVAPRLAPSTMAPAAPYRPSTGDSLRTAVTFAPATQVQPRPRPEINAAQFSRNRRAQAEAAPTIQVTIGRIEVRATPTPAQSTAERTAPAVMSLEEYLRQRNAQATNAHVAGGGSR